MELNSFLTQFEETVRRLIRELRVKKIDSTFDDIKKHLKDYFDVNKGDLFQKFDEFIESKKNSSASQINKLRKLKIRLVQFSNEKHLKIDFYTINKSLFEKYFNYLVQDQNLQNNAAMKEMKYLKSFVNYLFDEKLIEDSSFKKFEIKEQQIEVFALTKSELKQVKDFDFSKNLRLERVRDLFYFQCLTGVRFSDLQNIKNANINNNIWYLTTKKTKQPIEIPLLPDAIKIIKKYKTSDKPEAKALPKISNQKFNKFIKEAAKIIGLNNSIEQVRFQGDKRISRISYKYELISSHVARRTFVTLMLEQGVRQESVMDVTGISNFATLKKYMKITKQAKTNEMIEAFKKLNE